MDRRSFLGSLAGMALAGTAEASDRRPVKRPNLVFVFADQWRAQAAGYAGDPNAFTPNLDALAGCSVRFDNAVSGCPVCTPYRGSLMTGQHWLTHGLFMNDVPLSQDAVTIAKVLNDSGYDTGYIGKWHIDGRGRSAYIAPERRQGFQFWRGLECTHNYNNSAYYADSPEKLHWDGYDACAQTDLACSYVREHADGKPFALFLSWGPPHDPYETAPEKYRAMFAGREIQLRPNVPAQCAEQAIEITRGYYAHAAALDDCLGRLQACLRDTGVEDDTVFVFTSDHGDLLLSHAQRNKQQPYDESIRVPFLLRYPARLGDRARAFKAPLNTPDIMPTLLGLCGVRVPDCVEGRDVSGAIMRGREPDLDAALLMCVTPFGQWTRERGGKEYRGVRTDRYTYVRDLNGPWLLFDNETDPHQTLNRCNDPAFAKIQKRLDALLARKLKETDDHFNPGEYYIRRWGYKTDKTGTVPYAP